MKNIHVLPTDKPSRLYFDVVIKELFLQRKLNIEATSFPIEKRNIYITNDEEIKDVGWVIAIEGIWKNTITKVKEEPIADVWRKIILTTDQDLIKDGIQAIDDEFLEWFCSKNGQVDFVEVISIEDEKN